MTTATVPNLTGFSEHYGVKVSGIGEDSDLIALGHHGKRKALAAFNAYVRSLGFTGLRDYNCGGLYDPYTRISEDWAVVKTECGEDDCRGKKCRSCAEIRSHDWWIDGGMRSDAPGAFPVTNWS